MTTFFNLERIINRMSEIVGKASSFLIPICGGILFFEVIARYVFAHPPLWTHDISQFAFGASYLLGAAFVLLERKHVNMDIVYNRCSAKTKVYLNIFSGVVFLIFSGVIVWKGGFIAYESVKYKELFTQSVMEPPLYPMKIIFFIGCFLFMLQGISNLLNDIRSSK